MRYKFACSVLEMIRDDNDNRKCVLFSDEGNLHASGHVNRRNVWICRTENPHASREHVRETTQGRVTEPFFFYEKAAHGVSTSTCST
jgi:hypothetical protein